STVSLAAYLEAAESGDPVRLDAHARHLREHVDRLAAKSYWQAFNPAPEFVVLFIPGEAFLAPALERDPGLLEYAMRRRVHIATPTTLITMLRTASYAWQQAALSRNARAVFELGKELYERLGTMGQHVDELGGALTGAIKSYNRTVGSLETRVLVSARKLNDLGVVDDELDGPRPVEESPRSLSAAELTGHDAPSGTPLNGHRTPLEDVPASPEDLRLEDDHGAEEERPHPDPASEAVGFGGRATPERTDRLDRLDRRERWPCVHRRFATRRAGRRPSQGVRCEVGAVRPLPVPVRRPPRRARSPSPGAAASSSCSAPGWCSGCWRAGSACRCSPGRGSRPAARSPRSRSEERSCRDR